MTLKSFTTQHKTAAGNMLLEGAAPKAVAQTFGVHVSTIYALRKTLGHGHAKADRASHVVHLRLSDAEFRALEAFVVDAGLPSRTAALRSLIRGATGFLELRRDEFIDLSEVRGELKAQGRNLNQIAFALNKAARMGGAVLSPADRAFLTGLKQAYVALDGHVSGAFREVRQKGRAALHAATRL
ncbi:hypothetical protein SAMN05444339_11229 [Loktanella atrilutea]|uniref:Mobilisation protein (MobC) n=1 Tax=Loktanella atrilutea TaxID=366533 RepID=A0A1M5EBG3_LOKAT|nr:hypothetical protein [Loktanella atrilutea]SHF76603.1 hypothetical protein SAMN05444339_11229 [Loktanella atrilutea]